MLPNGGPSTGREITEVIATLALTTAEADDPAPAPIAVIPDALRVAPDLSTPEPTKAVLRRHHIALLATWAELADEPPSVRSDQHKLSS